MARARRKTSVGSVASFETVIEDGLFATAGQTGMAEEVGQAKMNLEA